MQDSITISLELHVKNLISLSGRSMIISDWWHTRHWVQSFFYAMGEFLDPREEKGVFAVILILTVAALLCVYQLLQDYWTDFNEKEALAATLMISFVPLFLGTCSYFNVDYLIFIFFIFSFMKSIKKDIS